MAFVRRYTLVQEREAFEKQRKLYLDLGKSHLDIRS